MLAIIGGTGVYTMEQLEVIEHHTVDTPFGAPSAPVVRGRFFAALARFIPCYRMH